MQETLAEQLYYFGYAKPAGQENPTGFYEFAEDTTENMANYYQFVSDSQVARKTVSQQEYSSEKLYEHNKGNLLEMFTKDQFANL